MGKELYFRSDCAWHQNINKTRMNIRQLTKYHSFQKDIWNLVFLVFIIIILILNLYPFFGHFKTSGYHDILFI